MELLLKNDGFNVKDDELKRRYYFIMSNLWRVGMSHGYSSFINENN